MKQLLMCLITVLLFSAMAGLYMSIRVTPAQVLTVLQSINSVK